MKKIAYLKARIFNTFADTPIKLLMLDIIDDIEEILLEFIDDLFRCKGRDYHKRIFRLKTTKMM